MSATEWLRESEQPAVGNDGRLERLQQELNPTLERTKASMRYDAGSHHMKLPDSCHIANLPSLAELYGRVAELFPEGTDPMEWTALKNDFKQALWLVDNKGDTSEKEGSDRKKLTQSVLGVILNKGQFAPPLYGLDKDPFREKTRQALVYDTFVMNAPNDVDGEATMKQYRESEALKGLRLFNAIQAAVFCYVAPFEERAGGNAVVSLSDMRERLRGPAREREVPIYHVESLHGIVEGLKRSLPTDQEEGVKMYGASRVEGDTAERMQRIVDRYAALEEGLSRDRMRRVLFMAPAIENTSPGVEMTYTIGSYPPMFETLLDLLEEQIDFIERTGQASLEARSGLLETLRSEEARNRMAELMPSLRSWKKNRQQQEQLTRERAALGEFPKQLDDAIGRSQRDFDSLSEELGRVAMPTTLRVRRPGAYRKDIRRVIGEDGSTWLYAEQFAKEVGGTPKPTEAPVGGGGPDHLVAEIPKLAEVPVAVDLSDTELVSAFQQSRHDTVISVPSMRGEDFGRLLNEATAARATTDSQYTEAERKWRQERTGLEKQHELLKTRVGILREMVGLTELSGFTEGKEPEVFVRGFLEEKKQEWPTEKNV